KRCLPRTRTILGLRDIMDDASVVKNDWENKGVYEAMEKLYDEIWIYGNRELYDPVQEYEVPEPTSKKMVFTGYIPRQVPSMKVVRKIKRKQVRHEGEKLVVVTAGGGGDGYAMMNIFLRMLERENGSVPFRSVIITGPFMPGKEREKISDLAKKIGVRTWSFYPRMEEILAAADLVVTMGGYNTLCEILTLGIVSLIIPREIPRKEQVIRAKIFSDQKMVDYIPWDSFDPDTLREKVFSLLENPKPYREAMSRFQLTGLEVISKRLEACRSTCK
ncbi:MAG: glycosyltransferase, partial [Deltaproteobacteria bacterium]|nr:glycosyltransferase [Deltaproteobacteria bacterium]